MLTNPEGAMASPLERREREKAELRTKILDAARELFVSEGYDAVTMRKVAERIEYSPTAIYLHFKDKEALIRDLCNHDFQVFAARFADVAEVADPIERLHKAGEVYVAFALQHPQQYRLMFMTPHPPVEPTGEEAEDPTRNTYVFLRAILEQAIREGRLRREYSDPELVAQTIWAATHGVVSLEIAQGCEKGWVDWRPIEDRVRLMADAIVGAFVGEGRATPREPKVKAKANAKAKARSGKGRR
jgi:AcrR family transcriptional regulator